MSYTKVLKEPMRLPLSSKSASASYSQGKSWTYSGSRSGSAVPKWKERIGQGLPASSPYSLDMAKLVLGPPLQDTYVYKAVTSPFSPLNQSVSGYVGAINANTSISHLNVDTEKARSVALSKLYKKLESDRSEMNASASLAEIGDVLRQFGRPFGALTDAFSRHHNRLYFERRRLKGRGSFREENFKRIAADTWLEVSFGLIPLFSEAESVAKSFGRFEYELTDSPKLRDRMRTRAQEIAVEHNIFDPTLSGVFCDYKVNQSTTTEGRAQYVVGLEGDVRADFGSNQRLLELLGLEPRNLPLALWEATPWSWLIDYFTNVQQILQAGATITSRVKWIVLSETKKTTVKSSSTLIGASGLPHYRLVSSKSKPASSRKGVLNPGEFELIRTTFNRTLPSQLGIPPLIFETPFGDLKKVANLIAIAVTKTKEQRNWLS